MGTLISIESGSDYLKHFGLPKDIHLDILLNMKIVAGKEQFFSNFTHSKLRFDIKIEKTRYTRPLIYKGWVSYSYFDGKYVIKSSK
jgi:hypothetical protein